MDQWGIWVKEIMLGIKKRYPFLKHSIIKNPIFKNDPGGVTHL
jgi:hypothetical protein